jgi:hypothetical protein
MLAKENESSILRCFSLSLPIFIIKREMMSKMELWKIFTRITIKEIKFLV